jgi:hypothetical protein
MVIKIIPIRIQIQPNKRITLDAGTSGVKSTSLKKFVHAHI